MIARWAAQPTFYRDLGFLSAGVVSFYLYNLEEVPVSGRRRFNIVPPALEEAIGESAVAKVRQEFQGRILPDSDLRVRYVQKVLGRLLPYAEGERLKKFTWEVAVIDSPEQNAFVTPGGKVFVFTGILPLCKDEHGIAAVLGHEIAHVVAHHAAERMSHAPFVLLGAIGLSLFDISFSSSKHILDLFLSLPASRKHEAEADYIGLMMMAKGCYRPEAAREVWVRMEQAGGRGTPTLLSTHPSNETRMAKIQEWLPEAKETLETSDCWMTGQNVDQFDQMYRSWRQ